MCRQVLNVCELALGALGSRVGVCALLWPRCTCRHGVRTLGKVALDLDVCVSPDWVGWGLSGHGRVDF